MDLQQMTFTSIPDCAPSPVFQGASPASRTALSANGLQKTMNGTCGLSLSGSSENCDHGMLLAKTLMAYAASSSDSFAQSVLDALNLKRTIAMQMALIGGECLLRPLPDKTGIRFGVIPRYNVLVFDRDADGNITDMGCIEESTHDKWYYTLLERRTLERNGYLTIRNKLYKAYNKGVLGTEVSLHELPQYENLQEEYTFKTFVGSVGVVRLATPMVNCVDGSADRVSVFAPAAGLIHNIDQNEAQLNGEFERGESRIGVSDDVLYHGEDGVRVVKDNVFVGLDADPDTFGFNIFSPPLRETSFLARKQEYLRNVENIIGLKRGLLSEVEAAERTATEITSSAGDYNLTIKDFQHMWEDAVREALRLCSILGQLYRIPGAHEVAEEQVAISWGNGVLFDEEGTRQRMLGEVQAGLLQPERYLGFTYKRPCDTPAQRARIRKDYMPEVDDLLDDEFESSSNLTLSASKQSEQSIDNTKSLNGAQTQSLLSVISQYQAGQLTIGQAINVLSVAIGVDKAKARSIIEGALE